MIEEKDVSEEERWHFERLALQCLKGLKKRNLMGYYFTSRNEAKGHVLRTIPSDATIGFGDSVTLYQIGVIEALQDRGQKIISAYWKDGKVYFPSTKKEVVRVGREALFADYFLAGINALTLDGEVVNTDGTGNRLAGIIFGPRKVILVAGVNKIVANVEQALGRIKEVAAPLNARRHHVKHGMETTPPCAQIGMCVDCRSNRMCCFTLIIEHQITPRIEVVLIGERLGL